ncbi:methionyl-tRNA formyltransferase [Candidatus Riesia pediculicola]|uniref:methionyl-tRNA formyltransferase n=1 Tax=Candidatus Riesia pediculicola TaxID=401619 RepID=UPI0009C1EB2A|nr:methionyl-tRNA formyltransferase [Candidatus Riesia pediculicola]ARC54329.1 hypothetical protein AOE57_01885 [Candidatus Riesia pediculicola]
MKRLRVIFAGSSHFSKIHLLNLLKFSNKRLIHIVGILSTPDRPSGRGLFMEPNSIKKISEELRIDCIQPNFLNDEFVYDWIFSKKVDIIIVAQYRLIFPEEILKRIPFGVWNIHCSLLPRWRGPSPIQYAILTGDERTGVSIVQMDSRIDTGDIIYQSCCLIDKGETFSSLYRKLVKVSLFSIMRSIELLRKEKIVLKKQNESLATYSKKINKEMAKISWSSSTSLDLERKIRAFQFWPVSYFEVNQETIKVLQAELVENYFDHALPGTIVRIERNGTIVSAKEGFLKILKMRKSGRKTVSSFEFKNYHLPWYQEGTLLK